MRVELVYEVDGGRSGAPATDLIARALVVAKEEAASRRRRGRLVTLASAIAVVSYLVSPAGSSFAAQSSATSSVSSVSIPVEGMTCASCSAHVKKALLAVEGVTDAEVSLEHRRARVRYLSGKVKPEDLVRAINRLGYKAGPPTVEDGAP